MGKFPRSILCCGIQYIINYVMLYHDEDDDDDDDYDDDDDNDD